MSRVRIKEIGSRLGNFSVIKLGSMVLVTPCDTRTRIVGALAEKELTSEEITQETGVAYSTVMDHLDVLERLGIVSTLLKRNGGRRRIYFQLNEDPLGRIDRLFAE